MLCDVRQQPGAAEEIYEYRAGRILLYDLDEMTGEHALLSNERQRSGKV